MVDKDKSLVDVVWCCRSHLPERQAIILVQDCEKRRELIMV